MTVLEQKEAIREVIDRFSTLEIDVKEQAKLFTPDAHVEVYAADGSKMMEFDGREKLIELFGGAMAGVKTAYHMNHHRRGLRHRYPLLPGLAGAGGGRQGRFD